MYNAGRRLPVLMNIGVFVDSQNLDDFVGRVKWAADAGFGAIVVTLFAASDSARAQSQPHILNRDAFLAGLSLQRLCQHFFEIRLGRGNNDVTFPRFSDDQKRIAVFVLTFVKNHVARFQAQTRRHVLDAQGARAHADDGSFAGFLCFSAWMNRRGQTGIELRAVEINRDLVEVGKDSRAHGHDGAVLVHVLAKALLQRSFKVACALREFFRSKRKHLLQDSTFDPPTQGYGVAGPASQGYGVAGANVQYRIEVV